MANYSWNCKVNAAAASAYLYLKSEVTPWSIWINFGIVDLKKIMEQFLK